MIRHFKLNQKGVAPLFLLFGVIGVLLFLAISSSAPFRSSLLSSIFPKTFTRAATINSTLGVPTAGSVINLDSTLRVQWTPSTDANVVWQVFTVWDGNSLINTKVVGKTSKAADANGIQYNKNYTIRVQSMNGAGELSNPLELSGRADPQLPMRNAAFYESFNDSPHGDLDSNYFDVRTSLGGDHGHATKQMVFNNERHFHTLVTGGGGKGGLMVRSRVPFDFTNRTGTLQLEVDLPPIQTVHGKWFEINLSKEIPGTDDDFGDGSGGQFPNSIEFSFRREAKPVIKTNINGTQREFVSDNAIFSPLNVRVPVVIKISRTSAEMFVNGQSVATASGFDLGFSKAYVTLAHRNYYPPRRASTSSGQNLPPIMVSQTVHWDTLQYDGPAGSYNPVVKTFIQPNCSGTVHYGANFGEITSCQSHPMNGTPVSINIPDSLANARSARFMVNADGLGTIRINGNQVALPADIPGVSGYSGSLRTVEIPVSWLRQGANDVSITRSTDPGRRMWQLEFEVIYNTPRIIANPVMNPMPMIGVTSQSFYVHRISSDPMTTDFTAYLYNQGATSNVNYQARVIAGESYLSITSPTSGSLTPISDTGRLVPLNMRVNYAGVDPDQDGHLGIIEITGGNMPMQIAVLAVNSTNGTHFTFAPATSFPSITSYSKAAIPDYYGDGTAPSPAPSATIAPSATLAPSVSAIPARTVLISSNSFNPNSLMVNVGETVTWVNNDAINHTVTSSTGAWTSRTLTPGQSFTHTFTQAGTFSYSCTIHPSMTANIVVHAGSPSPSGSGKPGDVDGNGAVDIFDYNALLTDFNKTGSGIPSDLDKNGKVDIFDLNLILSNFGK